MHAARDRNWYLDHICNRYFANVDGGRLDEVLACFTEDARIDIVTESMRFEGRDTGIRALYEALFRGYSRVWHGNFRDAIVDVDGASLAIQFDVELTPSGGIATRSAGADHAYYAADRIRRLYIFSAGKIG
jgi:hypothetical protein